MAYSVDVDENIHLGLPLLTRKMELYMDAADFISGVIALIVYSPQGRTPLFCTLFWGGGQKMNVSAKDNSTR